MISIIFFYFIISKSNKEVSNSIDLMAEQEKSELSKSIPLYYFVVLIINNNNQSHLKITQKKLQTIFNLLTTEVLL